MYAFGQVQIGNWSRWLTDLFGIDDDENDDGRTDYDTSFKSFHLLNALSDLMMLPKDMLLNSTVRKEVFISLTKISCKPMLFS